MEEKLSHFSVLSCISQEVPSLPFEKLHSGSPQMTFLTFCKHLVFLQCPLTLHVLTIGAVTYHTQITLFMKLEGTTIANVFATPCIKCYPVRNFYSQWDQDSLAVSCPEEVHHLVCICSARKLHSL